MRAAAALMCHAASVHELPSKANLDRSENAERNAVHNPEVMYS
jgi:hypothetical protein